MSFLLLQSGPCPPAFNMALDEALLEATPRLGQPVLRFYGWTEPAASFGYFQKYAEVERATLLRPLVRRPTGGGVVPHDADWTYSLAFPTGHEWYSLRAEGSYWRVHEWIQAAFAQLNVPTELAPQACSSRHKEALSEIRLDQSLLTSAATMALPGRCFVGHEKFDLLWHGKKIAGAAQRRTHAGLLIQGSIQPPPLGLFRADWEHAMLETMERPSPSRRVGARSKRAGPETGASDQPPRPQWVEFQLDAALRERAEELAAQKYSQATYTRKR
jgi:lipoate-protein ligase A